MERTIVIGHGHFATGLQSALELIMGIQTNIEFIDFDRNMSIDDLRNKIKTVILDEDTTVFVDLFAGSPFNVIVDEILHGANTRLFYGVTLGMLMEYVSKLFFDIKLSDEEIVDIGKNQVGKFILTNYDQNDSVDEL